MATKEKTQSEGESGPDIHRDAAERESSHHHPPAGVQPVEPEDTRQTGGNPRLQTRALNENVEGGQAQQHPESPAGQHATGSFTGAKKLPASKR